MSMARAALKEDMLCRLYIVSFVVFHLYSCHTLWIKKSLVPKRKL
jgi:hypothetical protein